jgi:pimeloyl-ACP methyl ester carboxylesterase
MPRRTPSGRDAFDTLIVRLPISIAARGSFMSTLARLLTGSATLVASLLMSLSPSVGHAQPGDSVKNIVLVHGAFADATSWSKVIPLLEADGYHVAAVQNPLTSLGDDVAATSRLIDLQDGPVLLVAHSWGGTVITQAGVHPKVVGLVYVSAYAPDVGQSANDASSPYGWTPGQKQIQVDAGKFVHMSLAGVAADIAECLPNSAQTLFYATQGQTYGPMFDEKLTVAAWREKPSWVLVSANDRMLPPAMELAEVKRLNAVGTLTLPTCHMSVVEQAAQVAAFINSAAKTAAQALHH